MESNLVFYLLSVVLINGICVVQPLSANIDSANDYSSYIRNPLCRASQPIRYPTSLNEVVSIIDEAIRHGVTVKAFGERHSLTDIICTDGIPVDMRLLKSMKMNDDNTATFGAGVTIQEAGEFLLPYGLALRVLPAYGNITLAGAIGTGAHGSSMKFHSTLSAQVAKMTIVDGRGVVKTISSSEDLKSFRIHLGLLGVIVDLTLNLVPLYKVKSENYVASDVVLENGKAIDWARTSDQLTFYWFPSIDEVVVSNFSFVAPETVGNDKIFMTTSFESNVLDTIYKESAYTLSTSDCTTASTFGNKMMHYLEMKFRRAMSEAIKKSQVDDEEQHLTVGYPHDILSSICSNNRNSVYACWWSHPKPFDIETLEIDFDFALTDLPAVARTIKEIVTQTSTTFPMFGIVLRFSAESDIYMSTSYKRDACHLEFQFWKRSDPYNQASGNLAGYQTISQVLTKKFKARSHWGKSGLIYHSSEMLDLKLDPFAREKFVAAMKKFDPDGVFLNNFGRRLTHSGTEIDIDPLTTRCALLDNCICSENTDCSTNQICTTVSGFYYPVCQTKNFVSTEFKRNDLPDSFEVGNWYFNIFPKLFSQLNC